ncbi:MAG: hypothetical protein ACOYOL_07270 [Chthoniobacterales bacterium]|jgi:hypothetical protein
MKHRLTLLALGAILVFSAACERIPPSVSIPDYGEKKAEQEKAGEEKLGTTEQAPTFFPAKAAE